MCRDGGAGQEGASGVEAKAGSSRGAGWGGDVWGIKRDPAGPQERCQPAAWAWRGVSVAWSPTDQGACGVSASTKPVQVLVGTTDVPVLITAMDDQSRITLVPVPGSARAAAS